MTNIAKEKLKKVKVIELLEMLRDDISVGKVDTRQTVEMIKTVLDILKK